MYLLPLEIRPLLVALTLQTSMFPCIVGLALSNKDNHDPSVSAFGSRMGKSASLDSTDGTGINKAENRVKGGGRNACKSQFSNLWYNMVIWRLGHQILTVSLHISYSSEQVQDNSWWTPSRSSLCVSFHIQREGIQRVYLSKRGCQGLVLHKSRWKWKTCRRAETMGILWERMPGPR